MPLYDMMREAHQGEAMRQMAGRFGLSDTQVADAFASLAPAFSAGLKRNVAGPQPMADFLSALSDGRHRRYFEDVQAALSPQGIAEGNGILDHLFGSKDLSRQVAAEAAKATGIGQDIFKQMLPAMASVIMGGLYSQATANASRPAGNAVPSSGNVVSDILKEMIRYQAAGRTDLPEKPAPSPFDNPAFAPFNAMLDAFYGKAAARPAGQAQDSEPPPADDADDGSGARTMNGYDEIFGQMFQAGREVQSGYQRQMESLFDQYMHSTKRQV